MTKDIVKKCPCGNVITVSLEKISSVEYHQKTTGAVNMDWNNYALCTCGKVHHFNRSIDSWWRKVKGLS